MLKIFTRLNTLLVICMLTLGFIVTSCDPEEDTSSEVLLHSYGPSPALRGGELKFIGANLDKVTGIVIPGAGEITSFKTHNPSLVVIEVPQAAVDGQVVVKTSDGDITPKTRFAISEPIAITSFSPAEARPGETISIKGTYLNLVEEVIFPNNKIVTDFTKATSSNGDIQVVVPEDAQTGLVIVSNGAEEPILVESETEFVVTLPVITSFSPNPVKAGAPLTIKGTNLDLTQQIIFGGDRRVNKENFVVSEAGDEITVTVPANSQDGKVRVMAASLVEVESTESLTMLVPTISSISPNPAKTSGLITVTGTNLDVVTSVTFGGGEPEGEIQEGGSATEITVMVPATAQDSVVTFYTAAEKSVPSSSALTLVKASVREVSATSIKTAENLTFTGANLDVIETIQFAGDKEAQPASVSADGTSMVVTVPRGAQSGKITLVSTNGEELELSEDFTIEPGNAPTITSVPDAVGTGDVMTIGGLNLDLVSEVIFPGNIRATRFGKKTATELEVIVPADAESGKGTITFVTAEGDVSRSPEFEILGALKVVIYDDAVGSGFGQWGKTPPTEWGSTEKFRAGEKAIKVTFAGAWEVGSQFGGGNLSTAGMKSFAFSMYGGAGTGGKKIQLLIKSPEGEFKKQVDIVEGAWTDVEVPFSELGNASAITEFFFQNVDFDGVVYFDNIGLK